MKSRELRATCSKVSSSVLTCLAWKQLWLSFTTKWSRAIVTFVTPTRNSIFQSFPQARYFKLHGMVKWFLSADLPNQKLTLLIHYPQLLYSIRNQRPLFLKQVTHQYCAALQFALTWVAFQCPILVPTKVGFAFATVQFTINSDVLDKDQQQQIFHTLTIRYMVLFFALKSKYSPTNPAFSSTCEVK